MKRCLKLAGKCLLVLLPLIALEVIFSQTFMSYFNGEAFEILWMKEKINTHQEKRYDVMVLGDSLANASYLPEVLSDRTINLGVSNMAPISCYYIMETWLENNEPPKVCYLSFHVSHLNNIGHFWEGTIFAHPFRFQQDLEVIKANAAYNGTNIWKSGELQKLLSYRLWLPKMYITSFLNASFNQRGAGNRQLWAARDLHYGCYCRVTTEEFVKEDITEKDIKSYETFVTSNLEAEYYERLIKLCQDNDIEVRIVHLPLPKHLIVSDTYKEEFYAYHDTLSSKYPGIKVDFFDTMPETCFSDVCHMNSYGAMRFSTELKKLYPEDFGDEPLTEGQIAGINDYISREVKLDHIFDWAAGRGYTMLLYDAQGIIPDLYGEQIDTEVSDVALTVMPLDGDGIYAVTDGETADVTVTRAEDGTLAVQLPGGEPVPWEVKPGAELSVFVIDAFGRTVCAKSFDYTEGPVITVMS